MLVIQVSGQDFFVKMSHSQHSFSDAGLWAIFNYFADMDEPQDFSPEDIILDFTETTFEDLRKQDDMESATVAELVSDVAKVTRVVGVTKHSIVFYSF